MATSTTIITTSGRSTRMARTPRRVTPEPGHFVTWSPDGDYLLISGRELYVVRPDGTGRFEIRTPDMPLALGGIPDWR